MASQDSHNDEGSASHNNTKFDFEVKVFDMPLKIQ